ncbi:MAG: DUF3750 domain-containing protein [Betaproteobacteria bacterium]|nr:DUF3750 domain-containing protein [Betaproteobacteria bacterium]
MQAMGAGEPVVQVWGARTRGAKGIFGIHSWVAVKPSGATEYTVYEVIGWRRRRTDTAVVVRKRPPNRWFGVEGKLYAEKRGPGVDVLIERIGKAAAEYPYARTYTVWPGPNSNTFTAWVTRAVPELEADLPATAIGKDYTSRIVSRAPSGKGFQFSLRGLLGVAASNVDGIELNILGLNFGISSSGIKLPIVGRIGAPRIAPVMVVEEPART